MFDANGVEAEQCLSVLRQLGRTGILTLHALQELDGGGLSLAALRACGCVISLLDFTTFMLWLQSADVHLSDKVHPDLGIVQSGLRDLSDCSQLSQPVGCDLVPMLAPSMPPIDLSRVAGAYVKTCIRWVDLLPCIVGKACSLESYKRVISLVLSKDYDAPLQLLSNTVLIDALCRSRAIFSITLES